MSNCIQSFFANHPRVRAVVLAAGAVGIFAWAAPVLAGVLLLGSPLIIPVIWMEAAKRHRREQAARDAGQQRTTAGQSASSTITGVIEE